ncbi:MAG: DUF1269 domain-containing protein [Ottowia sp.]
MNKIIVTLFDQETQAARLLNSLAQLHRDGRITVYGTAVFTKNADGKISPKQIQGDNTATWSGALLGGLLGALAGPVGLLAGAALGGLGGSLVDLADAGIDVRFADDVAKVLTPGKVAVLADIQEEWTAPVDEAVAAAGGIIYRRNKADIADVQWQRDMNAYQAELDALETELKTATDEQKAKLQQHIADVKKKIADTQSAWQQKLDKARQDAETKLKTLQEQYQAADDALKAKIQTRIDAVKADLKERGDKLDKAGELIKQALSR